MTTSLESSPVAPAPGERCATCAFRRGTPASLHEPTRLAAQLCVLSGETFCCHEAQRVGEPCRGWDAAVRRRGRQPAWRAELAQRFSDIFDDARCGLLTTDEAIAACYVAIQTQAVVEARR